MTYKFWPIQVINAIKVVYHGLQHFNLISKTIEVITDKDVLKSYLSAVQKHCKASANCI